MNGNEWTSEYYDIMEFYYWEPQHLGKIKNPKSRYNNEKKALQHIQNMEVSLNHMFNIFFRLAPSAFINQVISNSFGKNIQDSFTLQGRYDILEFSSLVQPDLLFSSETTNFSIEMKIGAKSSLSQVYKYALLHWLEQQHSDSQKKSLLLYVGKGSFNDLWVEGFTSAVELKKQALNLDISKLRTNAAKKETIPIDWYAVQSVLDNTDIAYCSYSEFSMLLKAFLTHLTENSNESETIHKLFSGLYAELERRALIEDS
jgi:hypothetical protein